MPLAPPSDIRGPTTLLRGPAPLLRGPARTCDCLATLIGCLSEKRHTRTSHAAARAQFRSARHWGADRTAEEFVPRPRTKLTFCRPCHAQSFDLWPNRVTLCARQNTLHSPKVGCRPGTLCNPWFGCGPGTYGNQGAICMTRCAIHGILQHLKNTWDRK